ncbi:CoA transferase [Sulfitobacter pontiacus]|uniref:CoA transferase n=1 Tax=Sulfitobacter pontiacus TaxID=60137 RepID=UPI0036DE89A0
MYRSYGDSCSVDVDQDQPCRRQVNASLHHRTPPPANMVGDFGGGAMMLAFGMVFALLDVQRGGKGTVIDAAMTDGSALSMSMIYAFHGQGW